MTSEEKVAILKVFPKCLLTSQEFITPQEVFHADSDEYHFACAAQELYRAGIHSRDQEFLELQSHCSGYQKALESKQTIVITHQSILDRLIQALK